MVCSIRKKRENWSEFFFNRPLSLVITSFLLFSGESFNPFANCEKIFLTFQRLESEFMNMLFYILFVKRKKKNVTLLTYFVTRYVLSLKSITKFWRIQMYFYFIAFVIFLFFIYTRLHFEFFKLDVSKFLIQNCASFIFIFVYLKIIIATWHFQISSFAVYKTLVLITF